MSNPGDASTLSCAPDALVQDRLRAFDEVRKRGERPDIAAFLPSTGAERRVILVRLAHADAPNAPPDLVALCMELLRRDRQARPCGAEIRHRLTETVSVSTNSPDRPASAAQPARPLFVGREKHLQELDNALTEVTSGRAVAVSVHGPSGVGKTALVQHFLDGLSERKGAVVLAGRCFEQESVPYKALDSLIDSLSRYLRRLTLLEAQALFPRDISQLSWLFPVLRRVDAVAQAPGRAVEAPDPLEVRRRAAAALRELLGRLGDRHPLVLVIDDLQGGDADSAVLVADLLRSPDPSALLLLGCSRSEDLEDSHFMRKCAAFLIGRWREARDTCIQAEDILRSRCTGAAWEIDMAYTFSLWSLTYLGEVAELTRRQPILLKEAQERGNRFAITKLSTYIMAVPRLAAGEAEEARQELAAVMGEWSQGGFHVQHHDEVLALVLIHLYRGEGEEAFRLVRDKWPFYKSSLLLRVQQSRIDIQQSRARSALAAAVTSRDPGPFLVAARRDARRLERERMPWSSACARLIQAGIAAVRGNSEAAVPLLADAEQRLESIDMRLCAAAARRRRGQLLGGEEGRALIGSADAFFASQQVKEPARLAAVYAPGFPD